MQLKRIFAILLAATLIFSATAAPVSAAAVVANGTFEVGVVAETTAPVSTSPAIYNSGDNVSVKISAVQNTGVTILKFSVKFDPNALELIGWTSANLFNNQVESINSNENSVWYTVMLNNSSTATGELFTLNFKVKDTFCGDALIYAEVFAGNGLNCINGASMVSFVGGVASFAAHKVDVAAGVVTAPTCTVDGYTTYHCPVCDSDVIGNTTDATGHTESAPVEENRVEATCTENGSYDSVVYCATCNEELSRVEITLPALGHSPAEAVVENLVEATCTETGSYDSVVYCSVCNEELSREAKTIDALGHDLVYHEAQDPDCTEIGWEAYEDCTRCDYTTFAPIHPLCHELAETTRENIVEATCTENGSYDSVVYCIRCSEELSRETKVIEALGHSTISYEAKDPTCTEIGWDAYEVCSRCDYTTYVEKEALGHSAAEAVEENRVEPNCTEAGSYEMVVYCTTCGEELSRDVFAIDALGHDLIPHEAKAPTCTEIGWNAYDTCSRCDYTTYQEIPHLCHQAGNSVIENRVEPTCVKDGSYESVVYCTVCQDELSRVARVIPALGHNYEAVFNWSEYHTSCTATITCDRGCNLNKVVDCTVTNSAANQAQVVHTAATEYDGVKFSDSVTCDNFLITFKDWDGTQISSAYYHAGAAVTAPADPTKAADNTYTYAFAGWDKAVVDCAGDAIYTATYTATYIDYTVEFKDWDGTVISSKTYHYGDQVTVPADPAKAADNTYTYAFAGWDNAVVNCAGDATYTATYTETYIDYTVVFKDWDGTVISTNTYHYGDQVTVPADPTKEADNTYTYPFAGWDAPVVDCAGDATYTAIYTPTYIEYTVEFKDWNGDVLSSTTYHWGDEVVVPPNPSRVADAVSSYSFIGWDSEITACDGDKVYTAMYKSWMFADVTVDSWQFKAASYVFANDLMAGKGKDENGNILFDPNNSITREEFVQVLYNAEGKPAVSIDNTFLDVADNSWYKNAVLWAKQNDIANGTPDGNFGVGKNITRQDLAMMLYKYAKLKGCSMAANEGEINRFADGNKVADYAKNAMDWAVTQGVLSGKGTTGSTVFYLDPTGTATRAECAAMLMNFMTGFGL